MLDLQTTDTDGEDGELLAVLIPEGGKPARLDKALADHAPAPAGGQLSRARIQALMAEGAVTLDGEPVSDASGKAQPGATYQILVPLPAAAEPEPQDIPLTVLYEDQHLIVIDKPPGMAAHPAPGTYDGTLVNALLYHCGASLSGVGGVARPGIVHRLDKDTSGIMVAAKSDGAHHGLSALFAAHNIERTYVALVRGAPTATSGILTTQIGRARYDRQRQAVLKSGGREATTHYKLAAVYGESTTQAGKPLASKVICTLETGRTHQIRVHMQHLGAPVLGDQIYGTSPPVLAVREAMAAANLQRQALHAAVLGFTHPITRETLRFETALPPDMASLQANLAERFPPR